MRKWVEFALILTAVSGCTAQDAQSSGPPQPSAEDLARQEELARQAAIQSEIHVREQSRDLIFTSLSGHQQRIESLRGDSSDVSNQLATLNNDVEAYLMDHKTAVVCMGAVGMTV